MPKSDDALRDDEYCINLLKYIFIDSTLSEDLVSSIAQCKLLDESCIQTEDAAYLTV